MSLLEAFIALCLIYLAGFYAYDIGHDAGQNELKDQVVLGLIERDGYYIINENYGSIRLNTTNRTEALNALMGEISPWAIVAFQEMQTKGQFA